MENNNQGSSTARWIAVSIIIASILISGTILYTNSKGDGAKNGNNNNNNGADNGQGPQSPDISKVNTQNTPFVGNASAPVAIAFWSDYQCPFCKRAAQESLAQIINEYVNTGKVKVFYKDFAFLGPDSQAGALAARAVWEAAPEKFQQWHDAMMENQDEENGGWGTRADILAMTKSLGIDADRVDRLMSEKTAQYQQLIDADKAEAGTFGITGTPSTIIGKQLVVGAQPYAAFKAAIDAALGGQ